MGRSIQDIKSEIAAAFMRNEAAAERYGFTPGTAFGDVFSAASVENILFYVFAVCTWAVEQLFDRHREEVMAALEAETAHRPKWYRDKALAFMAGTALEPDSDRYNTTGMTESEIAERRVVKHAVATESRDASVLTVKVAGEAGGVRCPLGPEEERQLRAYLGVVKDAGVRILLVNMAGDTFGCKVDVYYDPLMLPDGVKSACEGAIRDYIENLPFNGEYTNMALIDKLQGVEGVKIVELRNSRAQAENERAETEINARMTPAAGYFRPGEITVNMIAYDEQ